MIIVQDWSSADYHLVIWAYLYCCSIQCSCACLTEMFEGFNFHIWNSNIRIDFLLMYSLEIGRVFRGTQLPVLLCAKLWSLSCTKSTRQHWFVNYLRYFSGFHSLLMPIIISVFCFPSLSVCRHSVKYRLCKCKSRSEGTSLLTYLRYIFADFKWPYFWYWLASGKILYYCFLIQHHIRKHMQPQKG